MPFILQRDKRAAEDRADPSRARAQCQRCLRRGVWSFECACDAKGRYVSRPSATMMLEKPSLRQKYAEEQFKDDPAPGSARDRELMEARLARVVKKKKRGRRRESS